MPWTNWHLVTLACLSMPLSSPVPVIYSLGRHTPISQGLLQRSAQFLHGSLLCDSSLAQVALPDHKCLVRVTVTENHGPAAYKQQEFISRNSGGWTSRIRVPAGRVGPLQGCRLLTSHGDLTWQKEVESVPWIPCIRTLITLLRASPSWLIPSQRPLLLIPSHWCQDFSR